MAEQVRVFSEHLYRAQTPVSTLNVTNAAVHFSFLWDDIKTWNHGNYLNTSEQTHKAARDEVMNMHWMNFKMHKFEQTLTTAQMYDYGEMNRKENI